MQIELISKEEFDIILDIQKKHPILTFQNEGYQYVKKSKFTENDQKAYDTVSKILSKHISGYSEFNNFRLSKKTNELQLRVQYNYGYDGEGTHFIGVGYILLDELLNGFRKE